MTRKRSPEALALLYLRLAFNWGIKKLAAALGFSSEKHLAGYETGERPLSRDYLDTLVAPLGAPPEAVDVLLWVHERIVPKPEEETAPASPLDLTPVERFRIFRTALAAGWALAERLVTELTRQKKAQKLAAVRRAAQELATRLKSVASQKRRVLLDLFPEFRSWAVVEALSHDSERAASHSVENAMELAELAVYVAERLPGGEAERARAAGYGWCYIANALRVATEFDRAAEATKRSWRLWQAGEPARALPLAEWRLWDREASLRREQQRFPEALESIERALASCDGEPAAAGRILLNKDAILHQMGDFQGALEALVKAAPLVEATADPNQLFALRFNRVAHLCALERFAAAAALLPEVREMAVDQGRRFHLIRLRWLESKLMAGQGQTEEARACLEQVCQEFAGLDLPYEAALAALELAVIDLEAGRTAEVRELTLTMRRIFEHKGIAREAMVALALFCEAARRERATVELARQAIAAVERAQRSASPATSWRRGRRKARS